MKRTIKLMAMLLCVAALVTISSCEREVDPINNSSSGGNNGQTPEGWVDLGLPSGLLWAECNVGASSPEEYGDYFAWGETEPKQNYTWGTYAYGHANEALTKYCSWDDYGLNGFTDNLVILQPCDDAATANIGDGARMPTIDEWWEMHENCTRVRTTQNGVYGVKYTSSNGNSIFLPRTGYRGGVALYDAGFEGDYWSSLLEDRYPDCAYGFNFRLGGVYSHSRHLGLSVRAVRQN